MYLHLLSFPLKNFQQLVKFFHEGLAFFVIYIFFIILDSTVNGIAGGGEEENSFQGRQLCQLPENSMVFFLFSPPNYLSWIIFLNLFLLNESILQK